MGRPQPYIGVTGFMSREQVEHVLSVSDSIDRLIMVGVLVSDKTLRQETNKWPERYPRITTIRNIFVEHPRALNLLHLHAGHEKMIEYLYRALDMGKPHCQGFQLNIAWPSEQELSHFKHYTKPAQHTMVLQCGKKALDETQWEPNRIIERLRRYEGIIEYVLIDPSGGEGIPYNPEFASRCLREIYEALPWIGVGIAGGFSPGNVRDKVLEFRDFTDFSIDAEGRLQKPDGKGLDVELATSFVQYADSAFRVLDAVA